MAELLAPKCDICHKNIAVNIIKATNPTLTQGLIYQYKVCYKCVGKIYVAMQEIRRAENDT